MYIYITHLVYTLLNSHHYPIAKHFAILTESLHICNYMYMYYICTFFTHTEKLGAAGMKLVIRMNARCKQCIFACPCMHTRKKR